jgi:hypothetical protein
MNDDLLEELFNVVFELGGTIEPIPEPEEQTDESDEGL